MENITATLSVNLSLADLNDTLNYEINLKNTGTQLANNIILSDIEPKCTMLLKDTFKIDGENILNENQKSNYEIGSLKPGSSININFNVRVTGIPDNNKISNLATIEYEYSNVIEKETTNQVDTQIKNATIIASMTVDKDLATIEDILTYTVVLQNKGNVEATDIIYTNTMPDNVKFSAGSVQVDSVSYLDKSPITGIKILKIDPNQSVTISYELLIEYIPLENPIKNRGTISYNYNCIIDISRIINTNFTFTKVNFFHLTMLLKANKERTLAQEKIKYALYLINDGNVTAKNFEFRVSMMRANYERGSMKFNGVIPSRKIPSLTGPISYIKSVDPESMVIVEFDAVADKYIENEYPFTYASVSASAKFEIIPTEVEMNYTFYSNKVNTQLSSNHLNAFKFVNKDVVQPGDDINYKVCFGELKQYDSMGLLEYTIPPELGLISKPTGTENPIKEGIPLVLGNTQGLWGRVYNVNAKFNKYPLYLSNVICNAALINFAIFGEGGGDTPPERYAGTQIVSTYVPRSTLGLNKMLSCEYASTGDIITCCIFVTNKGDLRAKNVKLKEELPDSLEFIAKSVSINSIPNLTANPKTKINLGDIDVGDTLAITYKLKVIPFSIFNEASTIAKVTAEFSLLSDSSPILKTFTGDPAILKILNS